MQADYKSFHDYVHKMISPPTMISPNLYRRLGRYDVRASTSSGVVVAALELLETWSLLRLEHQDLSLAHLCPAGRLLSGYDPQIFKLGERLRILLKEKHIPSIEAAQQLYAAMRDTKDVSFRVDDLWIGGSSVENARYVAPSASHIHNALATICNNNPAPDILQWLGIAHSYAFLLLPFPRDNARWVGLWTHLLARDKQLPLHGILPFAHGIVHHKLAYGRDLLACAEGQGTAWQRTWEDITDEALTKAETIHEGFESVTASLMKRKALFGKTIKHVPALLELLASTPYVTLGDICAHTKITKPNGSLLIQKCLKARLLKQVTFDHRNRVYVAPDIVRLLSDS